jgi:hypothetical protein
MKQERRQKEVPSDVKDMARNAFLANKRMNKEKGVYEGLRKALLGACDSLKIAGFRLPGVVDLDAKDVTLDILVATPDNEVVSTEKLISNVFPLLGTAIKQMKQEDQKKFYGIFSCTKKAVEDYCGNLVMKDAVVVEKGTRNAFIKEVKEVG